MDGMPRNDSVDNRTEHKIVNHLDDEQFVRRCNNIISSLTNETYRNILRFTYIRPLATVDDVAERVGLSESGYFKARREALCAFAEWWPPIPSALLVYE